MPLETVNHRFRSLAGLLAVAMALASGPACLALGEGASLSGPVEPARHAHHGHHAHHGQEAADHDASHAELKHHCQCPAHRGVAPSGSHAGLPTFLLPAEVGAVFHATGLRLVPREDLSPDAFEPGPDPPIPLFLS